MSASDASLPRALDGRGIVEIGRVDHAVARAGLLVVCLLLALLPRLLGLSGSLTSDEGYWMQRTLAFGSALERGDWKATYRVGHPGVTVTWIGLLGIGPSMARSIPPTVQSQLAELEERPDYLEMLFAARRAIALVSGVLTVTIVALAWRLLGPGPASVGGLLVLLDPYLIGTSQLLHVDTLLAPLMAVSALAGLVYWTRCRCWPYLVLSGVTGGLALLTKAPAVCLPVYLGLLALAVDRPWRNGWRACVTLLLWAGVAALVYVALWPAVWVEPIRRLGQVARFALSIGGSPHSWSNFFLGQPVDDPGWLYYPVALGFRLGPPTLLGLAGLAVVARWRELRSGPVFGLITYVVLFVVVMTLGPKKFDRYMLPSVIALDLLAGVGLWVLARQVLRGRLRAVLLAFPLLAQALLLWQAYPHPIAFYNPVLGGATAAQRAIMVGWGEGLEQSAAYLNAQPDAERLIVTTHYHHVLRPLFRGATVRTGAYLVPPEGAPMVQPDYFVLYVNMAQRGLIPASVRPIIAGPPEHTAVVHGVEYARIYRLPARTEPLVGLPADAGEGADEE